MFFVLKSKYNKNRVELLSKIWNLRKKASKQGEKYINIQNQLEKEKDKNKILEQQLYQNKKEINILRLKFKNCDTKIKSEIEKKTAKYEEHIKKIQSSYDKLFYEMNELKKLKLKN